MLIRGSMEQTKLQRVSGVAIGISMFWLVSNGANLMSVILVLPSSCKQFGTCQQIRRTGRNKERTPLKCKREYVVPFARACYRTLITYKKNGDIRIVFLY